MSDQIETRPYFTIDPEAEQYMDDEHGITVGSGVMCLQSLQRVIDVSPQICLDVLSGTLIVRPFTQEVAEVDATIHTVLATRLDKYIEYDETSDEYILNHPSHVAARAAFKNARSYDVSKNGLGTAHQRHSHPEGNARRDAMRLTTLTLYVERVMNWQIQHSAVHDASKLSSFAA